MGKMVNYSNDSVHFAHFALVTYSNDSVCILHILHW